jgi:hypothetical protein
MPKSVSRIRQNWFRGWAQYSRCSSDRGDGKLPRMRSTGELPMTGVKFRIHIRIRTWCIFPHGEKKAFR